MRIENRWGALLRLRLLILSLPIWFRISIGVFVAVTVPTVLAFAAIQNEIRNVDSQNLRSYVTDRGRERQQDIIDIFNRANSEVANFGNNNTTRELLLRIMVYESQVDSVTLNLLDYMDNQLIGSGLFRQIVLLNDEGTVLLSNRRAGTDINLVIAPGIDHTDSDAYQYGQEMVKLQETERLIVGQGSGNATIIEVVYVVYFQGEPAGYVVATLDLRKTVLRQLSDEVIFVEANSYLATSDRKLIASDGQVLQARASIESSPIDIAFENKEGTATYLVNGEEYIGHYIPIQNTSLVMITETRRNVTFAQSLLDFYNQGGFILLGMLLLGGGISALISYSIIAPLNSLQSDIQSFGSGELVAVETVERRDEIGKLARAFVGVREQFQNIMGGLESRIADRVRDVQATQEVARFAAGQRDLQALMDNVVDLIIEVFPNIYHAQIFLTDEDQRNAILRASTGEAGRQLLNRGHRLAVGGVSVIGQVTGDGRVVVARDTVESDVHRKNEFLQETRAELAIPLRIGNEIIGALDVQSKFSDTFTEDQIMVLQTMADQIATAIENTRLYQESLRQLDILRATEKSATRLTWKEYMDFRREEVFVSQAGAPAVEDTKVLREHAIRRGVPVVGNETSRNTIPFAVPIQLREHTLGAVEWELPIDEFSNEKVSLAQELVNRLALSLDNARLFQESRRAINRERLVNEIAATLTGQTNINEILKTAVKEVGQALRVPQVSINLLTSEEDK